MNTPIHASMMHLAMAGLGGKETFLLIGFPLLYLLPIWLSVRKYGPGQSHWRLFSILAVLALSWIGFILIHSIKAGIAGYVDGAKGKKP